MERARVVVLIVAALVAALFLLSPASAQHSHSHDHGAHSHSHGHSHSHSHSHAHAHDDHAHDHAHDHDHDHDHDHEVDGIAELERLMHEQSQKAAESTTTDSGFLAGWSFKSRAKLNAVLATLLVSVAPVFILPLIPIDHTPERQPLLKVLLSFAVGGLLSDVFLHLIPHALSSGSGEGGHSHGHSHSHSHGGDGGEEEGGDLSLTVGLGVLAGLLTFFVVEKFVRSRHGGGGHGHSHGAKPAQEKKTKGGNEKEKKLNKKEKKQRESVEEGIKVGGFLNLAADMTHNFTDGLAIASSFLVSTPVGVTTTVAVLVHEIPHEIGDFAILLQSGFSRGQAMAAQFATAVGAFLGCLLGVLLEHGLGNTTHYILPFTAGGFIYIATVDVLPDLLQDSSFKQTFKEVFAFLVGVGLMVAVAQYEESM